jgi:DNA-binding NarL/FixJ family response regulator
MPLVLVISNDATARAMLAKHLGHAGCAFVEAPDEFAGLAVMRECRPDIVLCDLSVPGMRGDRLMFHLQRRHPEIADTPFLFFAGDGFDSAGHAPADAATADPAPSSSDSEVLVRQVFDRLARDVDGSSDLKGREAGHVPYPVAALWQVLDRLPEAVIVVDNAGNAAFVNGAAKLILARDDGLGVIDGRLVAADKVADAQIREALVRAAMSSEPVFLNIDRPSGKRGYPLFICGLNEARCSDSSAAFIAVFLADPAIPSRLPVAWLCKRYGFTPKEGQIVADLAEGRSVDEIGHTQKVHASTVHHHLKSIFRKTQTFRQSELISLVLCSSVVDRDSR